VRAALGRGSALAVQAPDHDQVLEAREVLVDGRVLAGQADARAQRGRVADDVEARDQHGPGVGLEQRREDADRGRLARAVGAEEPEDGARRDVEVDAIEGPDVAEGLHEPGHADRRLARVHPVHRSHDTKDLGQILAAIADMLGTGS
jgi:hypothetical protein